MHGSFQITLVITTEFIVNRGIRGGEKRRGKQSKGNRRESRAEERSEKKKEINTSVKN